MKKRIGILTSTVFMCAATIALAQNGPMTPHSDERYKELQSMRVWYIIQQLDLDARSERGAAILSLINSHAESTHELLVKRHEKMQLLYGAFQANPADDGKVESLIIEIEGLQQQMLEAQRSYQSSLQESLTPMERAKLMIAEEKFRSRLRRAMQGGRHSGGGSFHRR